MNEMEFRDIRFIGRPINVLFSIQLYVANQFRRLLCVKRWIVLMKFILLKSKFYYIVHKT